MTRLTTFAALALLAAGPAAAQTYTLDKIDVEGLKSADPATLTPKLPFQPGAKVAVPDLIADQDALTKELEAIHVTGGVKTSMRNKNNGHVDLILVVNDTGIQQPKTIVVAPKLKAELFVGNVKLKTEDLQAASGLKPGDDLNNDKIAAAQLAIQAAYKKADVTSTIAGSIAQDKDGTATITWTITEAKAKKKKRNTEDEGYKLDN